MPPKKAASRSQPPPPMTQLAEIYSYPTKTSGNQVLQTANERKSGLTPVYPPKRSAKNRQTLFNSLEKYQRDRFHGFTTAELRILDSLAPYYEHNEDPFSDHLSQLNYIHPVFARSRWTQPLPKHVAFFPFGNKRDGFWDPSKDEVWKLLEPGIKLASQTLINAHTWPWWEALVAGNYSAIPSIQFKKKDRDRTFYQFGPAKRGKKLQHQQEFASMTKNIEFYLMSEYISPHTGLERKWTVAAETEPFQEGPSIIWFSIELVAPLLDQRISYAERMLCHFRIAVSLVHEFTHAIWQEKVKSGNAPGVDEPYFGTELWAELGFSMEMAVFGGLTHGHEFNQPSYADTRGLPNAGYFQAPIFRHNLESLIDLENNPVRIGKEAPGWNEPVYYPVPLSYFFKLHQPEFWDYAVRRYGTTDCLRLGPKLLGAKQSGSTVGKPAINAGLKLPLTTEEEVSDELVMTDGSMSAAQELEVARENARRKHILQIQRILAAWKDPPILSASLPIPPVSGPLVNDDGAVFCKPRRDEIRTFLLENREILAFGTMHFQMGEHVLLSHIRRLGGNLNLTHSELRGFLLNTSSRSRLFSIELIMEGPMPQQALVTVIRPGWNEAFITQAIARPGYTTPSAGLLQWFDRCTDYVMDRLDYFNSPSQFDYDIDEFRKLARIAGEELEQPSPYSLTKKQFRDCVCEYESRNVKWALGPPGIIRKLATGWPESVAAAGQKRKAESMERQKKCWKKSQKKRKKNSY